MRRLDVFCDPDHVVIIKIKPRNGVVGFWIFRFLFNRDGLARLAKLNDPKTLRIVHMVTKDCGAGLTVGRIG
ncbi:hypothetical protein D3C81_1685460 [compost metagenome]